jgi:hypothetical protein
MKNKIIKFILNADAKWPPAYKYLLGLALTPLLFLLVPIIIISFSGYSMWTIIMDTVHDMESSKKN